MSEITSIELEALTFTYGEDSLKVLRTEPLCIRISIAPHTGEVALEQYVNATLLMTTSVEYPAEAPIVQLQNPQGMSDTRIDQVITQLQNEAQNLLGDMMLGSLIEAAKDVMTEMNQPEGHCIFCLEDLVPPQTKPSQETLLRLPCYHCYHLQCFAAWWHWQQSDMQQKAAQIQKDLQSAGPQRLLQDGLVPNADGLFPVPCPVCRLIFLPEDVPHIHDHRRYACQGTAQQPLSHPSSGFSPEELHKLMLEKQKRATQFARQQQQGGIVSERYGTSIAALLETQQPAVPVSASDASTEERLQTHDQQPLHQHCQQQQQNALAPKPSQAGSNWSSQGRNASQPTGHASHDRPGQSSLQQNNYNVQLDQGSKKSRNRRGQPGRGPHQKHYKDT